jgi:hypothetical protein
MRQFILAILLIPIYSFSQNRIDSLKTLKSDTVPVWPLPKGSIPPPINMAGKKVKCYAKDNKGVRCINLTTGITGLCKKHVPKFEVPVIMADF